MRKDYSPQNNELHKKAKKSSRSKYFSNKVMELIRESYFPETLKIRHGAILVKGGKIIAFGVNSAKNHPMAFEPILRGKSNRDIANVLTLHAEMNCFRSIKNKENINGSIMYVGRLSQDKNERMSCPCESCQYYLQMYGVRKVVYSTGNENEWYEVRI
jgi:deoxycytidylate deaminase